VSGACAYGRNQRREAAFQSGFPDVREGGCDIRAQTRSAHRVKDEIAHPIGRRSQLTAAILAASVAGVALYAAAAAAPLTHHMSVHIALMNFIAPVAAIALLRERWISRLESGSVLTAATVAQLAILWVLHAPFVLDAVSESTAKGLVVLAALFGTALLFWLAVAAQRGIARWRALVALLLTGKLFCLLAALLVFAPRQLYPGLGTAGHSAQHASDLADQQFAGLLMIAVCPLTYVLAAVVIAARWLKEMMSEDVAVT
jgi:putative membrane protein